MVKRYPVSVEVSVHITDGDTDGAAKFTLGANRLPTDADMPGIFEEVSKALPAGFRLMSRHESMMFFLRDVKGYRGPNLALPSLDPGEEWHDPETANTMTFNDDEQEEEE